MLDKDSLESFTWKFNKAISDVVKEYMKDLEGDVLIAQTRFESMIQAILPRYFRWLLEGKPKYRDDQYYYDSYHNMVEYDFENNEGEFNIQIFDSPDYDVWIRGKFKLVDGYIKITELSSYRT